MNNRNAPKLLHIDARTARERRARIIAIVEKLPEASVVASGNHVSLEVRQKRFGWLLEDHHDDRRLALNCKAPRGLAAQLVSHGQERFSIPRFVGHLGWVGSWLDTKKVDWAEVEALLTSAYRLTAPKSLLDKLDTPA